MWDVCFPILNDWIISSYLLSNSTPKFVQMRHDFTFDMNFISQEWPCTMCRRSSHQYTMFISSQTNRLAFNNTRTSYGPDYHPWNTVKSFSFPFRNNKYNHNETYSNCGYFRERHHRAALRKHFSGRSWMVMEFPFSITMRKSQSVFEVHINYDW